MLAPEDRWRVAVTLRNIESGPLQIILSRVSTIGARRAKVSAPGRRHERRLALVANSHYAEMEACAIAKAKRRPSWTLACRAELNPA
jgi:hypothetical protein